MPISSSSRKASQKWKEASELEESLPPKEHHSPESSLLPDSLKQELLCVDSPKKKNTAQTFLPPSNETLKSTAPTPHSRTIIAHGNLCLLLLSRDIPIWCSKKRTGIDTKLRSQTDHASSKTILECLRVRNQYQSDLIFLAIRKQKFPNLNLSNSI